MVRSIVLSIILFLLAGCAQVSPGSDSIVFRLVDIEKFSRVVRHFPDEKALYLNLTPEAAKRLEDFSAQVQGKKVSLFITGKLVNESIYVSVPLTKGEIYVFGKNKLIDSLVSAILSNQKKQREAVRLVYKPV